MKVSIIVPIYNVEKYLRICIESVISQSYPHKELLLIDDGSRDNSRSICKEYEEKYPFIRTISKENGGLSDARNRGIRESVGDYILFLDADDFWETDFLQGLMNTVQVDRKLEYVFFRYKRYFQKKGVYYEPCYGIKPTEIEGTDGFACLEKVLRANGNFAWFAWLGLVKKSFLLEHDLFFQTGKNYEDVLWTPQVVLKAKHVGFFDKAVYIYRLERDGQITASFNLRNLKDSIYASAFWFQELNNYDMTDDLRKALLNNLMNRFFVAIWFAGFLKKNERHELVLLLKENRSLLSYGNDISSRTTKILCNIFGFTGCAMIFRIGVSAKRAVKNHLLAN